MSTVRTRRRALWMAPESNYSVDPGGGYLAIPALELSELNDQLAVIERNVYVGTDAMAPNIAGPDAVGFSFGLEVIGFSSSVGDGQSPPANDYFDALVSGVLGSVADRDGVAASQAAGVLTMAGAADEYDVGDIIPVLDANGNSRWLPPTADGADGTYTVQDITAEFTPTLAPGCRLYRWDDGRDLTGSFTSVFDHDASNPAGAQYTLTGTKLTACTVAISPSEQAKINFEVMADAQVTTVKTGLPANTGETPSTGLRNARVFIDDVELPVSSIEIGLGLEAQPLATTGRFNGRSDHLLVSAAPTFTVTPTYTDDLLQLKRTQALRSVLVQLGLGSRSVAFFAPVTQAAEFTRQDDGGIMRASMQFAVKHAGYLASGDPRPRFVVGRI